MTPGFDFLRNLRGAHTHGKARVSVYIDVESVEDLYAQLRERLEKLPREQVETVVIQPWGQKEFRFVCRMEIG